MEFDSLAVPLIVIALAAAAFVLFLWAVRDAYWNYGLC